MYGVDFYGRVRLAVLARVLANGKLRVATWPEMPACKGHSLLYKPWSELGDVPGSVEKLK